MPKCAFKRKFTRSFVLYAARTLHEIFTLYFQYPEMRLAYNIRFLVILKLHRYL